MLHLNVIDTLREKHNDKVFLLFRVMVGLLFAFHGAQKLFGLFTTRPAQPLFSLMGLAGVIELFGGLLIAAGLFTSVIAAIAGAEMLVAFFKAHFTMANPVPIMNGGELALLYFAVFAFLFVEGSGKYSLDAMFCKDCKRKHV